MLLLLLSRLLLLFLLHGLLFGLLLHRLLLLLGLRDGLLLVVIIVTAADQRQPCRANTGPSARSQQRTAVHSLPLHP